MCLTTFTPYKYIKFTSITSYFRIIVFINFIKKFIKTKQCTQTKKRQVNYEKKLVFSLNDPKLKMVKTLIHS